MSKKIFPALSPAPYARAVKAGDFVFVSGQIAFGPDGIVVNGGIELQTRVVIENIEKTLKEAGCTLGDVVKATIWLDDVRDFRGFNEVYAQFFKESPPTRATVRADLMRDAKIEMEVIAYKPERP